MIAASDIGSNFAVQADGSLWAWGNDEYGQLGLGGSANPPEPQQVDLQDVVGVATGGDVATYALTSDGMVWGWGRGIPDMATGSTVDTPTPIRVMVPSPVSQLVGSEGGLCVLTEDGQVWAWGEGIGFPAPAQVPGLASVRQVAMSDSVGLALLDDGTVWGWGGGQWGDIGDGTRLDRSTPVEVSGLDGVTAIAKGESSSYALRSDGTVWCWGFNLFGQCGTGATPASESSPDADYPAPVQVAGLSGVRQIASGMQMGYAWTADGIWAWGNGWAMNMIDSTAVPAGFSGVPKPALLAGLPPIKSIADAESPLMIVGTP
ncbi:MAG: hypothetical protein FWF28_05475 [Micrococcales bacterium]|nr:hypothetical protein [Micrococcales bacterium]